METIKHFCIFTLAIITMSGCYEEADPLIADLYSDEVSFQNEFATEYLISAATSENIADRLIWNEVTTLTTNQYELQASATADFADPELIGITNTTNHVVLVEDLLNLANDLGLNAATQNTGVVYFRVKASIGNGGAGSDEIMSEAASINIKLIEGNAEPTSFWAVGDAVPGGWSFNDSTVELVEVSPDVWSANIPLTNNIFRFFQNFGTWDLNNNYAYYEEEGYTIDANFEMGPSDDANFNFIGTPGTYELTINAVDKTITLN